MAILPPKVKGMFRRIPQGAKGPPAPLAPVVEDKRAKGTAAALHPAVRNFSWPALLALVGLILAQVMVYLPAEVRGVAWAIYGGLCAIFNPTAGKDQPWLRLK